MLKKAMEMSLDADETELVLTDLKNINKKDKVTKAADMQKTIHGCGLKSAKLVTT